MRRRLIHGDEVFDPDLAADPRADRGSAIIEMLVLVPVFLLILSGVVDFAVSVNDRAALVEVSRSAGRALARSGEWRSDAEASTQAQQIVQRLLTGAGYDPARCRLTVEVVNLSLGEGRTTRAVEVSLEADAGMRAASLIPGRFFRSRTTSTFRLEPPDPPVGDS